MKTGVPLFSGVIIYLKTFKKMMLHLNRAKKNNNICNQNGCTCLKPNYHYKYFFFSAGQAKQS